MREYIVSVDDDQKNFEEMFIGNVRDGDELVRCKDCKHYRVYEIKNYTLPLCNRIRTQMADSVEPNDFCSRAEKK